MLSTMKMPDLLMWKKDLDLQYVDANATAAEIFGFGQVSNMLGRTDFDIPADLSRFADVFRAHDRRVMTEQKTQRFLEIQPCVDGLWKVFLTVKFPAVNENNKMDGIIGYATDVTDLYTHAPGLLSSYLSQPQEEIKGSVRKERNACHYRISKQQENCIFFLLRGKTTREIAHVLGLSPRTVENYIDVIKSKLRCDTKYALIVKLIELGYLYTVPSRILRTQLCMPLDNQ